MKVRLFLVMLVASCRTTNLANESFSVVDNELFCKGTKNMIVYLKQSQEIKNSYKDFLHNKGQVGLKISNEVFKGPPPFSFSDFGFNSTDTLMTNKVNYQCYNQSDNTPDFEVTFTFYPKKKILTALVWKILDKPGYRSGYQMATRLEENGQLGQMKISTIQE